MNNRANINRLVTRLNGTEGPYTIDSREVDNALNELVSRLNSSFIDAAAVQKEIRALIRRVALVHHELDVLEAQENLKSTEHAYKVAQQAYESAKAVMIRLSE